MESSRRSPSPVIPELPSSDELKDGIISINIQSIRYIFFEDFESLDASIFEIQNIFGDIETKNKKKSRQSTTRYRAILAMNASIFRTQFKSLDFSSSSDKSELFYMLPPTKIGATIEEETKGLCVSFDSDPICLSLPLYVNIIPNFYS